MDKMKQTLIIGVLTISVLILFSACVQDKDEIDLCSSRNADNCDSTCGTDDDCVFQVGCGCLNKNEYCSGEWTGIETKCECRINQCEKIIECSTGLDCQYFDCSKHGIPGAKEGYEAYCIENKCKCMCYGCD